MYETCVLNKISYNMFIKYVISVEVSSNPIFNLSYRKLCDSFFQKYSFIKILAILFTLGIDFRCIKKVVENMLLTVPQQLTSQVSEECQNILGLLLPTVKGRDRNQQRKLIYN